MIGYLKVSIVTELLCLIAAVVYLRKDRMPWLAVVFYLPVVVLTETAGIYLRQHHHANQWVYNLFMPIEAIFHTVFYNYIIKSYYNFKPAAIAGLVVIGSLYIGELCIHGLKVYCTLSVTVMSVLYIIYGLIYYYLLIQDEKFVRLRVHAPFWWVTGTIMFYFGSSACDLFFLLVKFDINTEFPIRRYIYYGLIIILYASWIYSFRCRYRYNKPLYSSSSSR